MEEPRVPPVPADPSVPFAHHETRYQFLLSIHLIHLMSAYSSFLLVKRRSTTALGFVVCVGIVASRSIGTIGTIFLGLQSFLGPQSPVF